MSAKFPWDHTNTWLVRKTILIQSGCLLGFQHQMFTCHASATFPVRCKVQICVLHILSQGSDTFSRKLGQALKTSCIALFPHTPTSTHKYSYQLEVWTSCERELSSSFDLAKNQLEILNIQVIFKSMHPRVEKLKEPFFKNAWGPNHTVLFTVSVETFSHMNILQSWFLFGILRSWQL